MSSEGFRALDEDLLHQGTVVSFNQGEFEAPDGSRFRRDVVRHPGAVSVVALTRDGDVVLVRQYRAALDASVLEIPAGKRDVAHEPPEITARRELVEEVGLEAERLTLLAHFHNSPGFSDEESYVYLATGLTEVDTDLQGPEEAHMTVHRVPLASIPDRVAADEITDAKTIIGCLLALRHQELAR
ncbi:MAG TPA: NUDIX hydrolase [Acidimicrobiales bacterium]